MTVKELLEIKGIASLEETIEIWKSEPPFYTLLCKIYMEPCQNICFDDFPDSVLDLKVTKFFINVYNEKITFSIYV